MVYVVATISSLLVSAMAIVVVPMMNDIDWISSAVPMFGYASLVVCYIFATCQLSSTLKPMKGFGEFENAKT